MTFAASPTSPAGIGSAPIAHAAVKTPEPVTEGVVAGLEPFIDTIFVCTVTGLVILCTGLWNRPPALSWDTPPALVQTTPGHWSPAPLELPASATLKAGDPVFVMLQTEHGRSRLYGSLSDSAAANTLQVDWSPLKLSQAPSYAEPGLFADYRGATLVAKGFDSVHEGLGRWLITIAVWVFSLSTLISYGYYGEQAVIFLGGEKHILAYRLMWCAAAALACFGWLRTSEQLDAISTVGMGFMYAINLPMMLFLGPRAMRAWHDYFARLKARD